MTDLTKLQQRRNDILADNLPYIRRRVTFYLYKQPGCKFLADDILQNAMMKVATALDAKLAKCPNWMPDDGGFAWDLIIKQGIVDAQRLEKCIQTPRINPAKRVPPPPSNTYDGDDWLESVEADSQPTRDELRIRLQEFCRTDAEALVMLALMARVKIADIAKQLKMPIRLVRAMKKSIGERIPALKMPAPSAE